MEENGCYLSFKHKHLLLMLLYIFIIQKKNLQNIFLDFYEMDQYMSNIFEVSYVFEIT